MEPYFKGVVDQYKGNLADPYIAEVEMKIKLRKIKPKAGKKPSAPKNLRVVKAEIRKNKTAKKKPVKRNK